MKAPLSLEKVRIMDSDNWDFAGGEKGETIESQLLEFHSGLLLQPLFPPPPFPYPVYQQSYAQK